MKAEDALWSGSIMTVVMQKMLSCVEPNERNVILKAILAVGTYMMVGKEAPQVLREAAEAAERLLQEEELEVEVELPEEEEKREAA